MSTGWMPIPRPQKLAYSFGSLAAVLSYTAFSTYLLFFYVDVLRLPSAWAGMGMIVYGLWNAFNDPLAGYISDRTRSRWGRRKPYIMFGSLPLLVAFAIVWTPPSEVLIDAIRLFVYFVVVINLFDTIYTFVILNWTALFPEMFTELGERGEVSGYRQAFGVIGLIMGIAAPPLIYGALGWAWMGVSLGIITFVSLFVSLLGIREEKAFSLDRQPPLTKSLSLTLKNRSFLSYVLANFALQYSYVILMAVAPFYTKYVLKFGDVETALFLLIIFLTAIPFLWAWVRITVKIGPKKSYSIALWILALLVLSAFFGTRDTALPVAILIGVGLSGTLLLPDVVLSDVIDEDELKSGARREGMYFGMNAFFIRLAVVLQGITIGAVLALSGYIPDVPAQPPSAILGLRALMGVIPMIALIIGGLLIWRFYPLYGETLRKIKDGIKKLHGAKFRKPLQQI